MRVIGRGEWIGLLRNAARSMVLLIAQAPGGECGPAKCSTGSWAPRPVDSQVFRRKLSHPARALHLTASAGSATLVARGGHTAMRALLTC
jgi:hypothetical protein